MSTTERTAVEFFGKAHGTPASPFFRPTIYKLENGQITVVARIVGRFNIATARRVANECAAAYAAENA